MIFLSVVAVLLDAATVYFVLRFWISDAIVLLILTGIALVAFLLVLIRKEWKTRIKMIKTASMCAFILFSVCFFIKSFGMENGSHAHLLMMAPWIFPILAEVIMTLVSRTYTD